MVGRSGGRRAPLLKSPENRPKISAVEPSHRTALDARALAARECATRLTQQADAGLVATLDLLAQQAAELAELRTKVANLEFALQTNRRIGQAIGIIMARKLVTEEEAFTILQHLSQRDHRKLRDIAEVVVLTGEVPAEAA